MSRSITEAGRNQFSPSPLPSTCRPMQWNVNPSFPCPWAAWYAAAYELARREVVASERELRLRGHVRPGFN